MNLPLENLPILNSDRQITHTIHDCRCRDKCDSDNRRITSRHKTNRPLTRRNRWGHILVASLICFALGTLSLEKSLSAVDSQAISKEAEQAIEAGLSFLSKRQNKNALLEKELTLKTLESSASQVSHSCLRGVYQAKENMAGS